VQVWIQSERLLGLFDDCAADHVHDLSNIESVLNSLSVISMKSYSLLLHLNFVALIIFNISSIDHPEIEVDV
jgi:hypothetical protein